MSWIWLDEALEVSVDPAARRVRLGGRSFKLVAIGQTSWRVIEENTLERTSFSLAVNPGGTYFVRNAITPRARVVGIAWISACSKAGVSPLADEVDLVA